MAFVYWVQMDSYALEPGYSYPPHEKDKSIAKKF
jgi:hypothetical protein